MGERTLLALLHMRVPLCVVFCFLLLLLFIIIICNKELWIENRARCFGPQRAGCNETTAGVYYAAMVRTLYGKRGARAIACVVV